MPFGIKDPLSYTRRDNVKVIHADSYDCCQVCGKETAQNEDGYVPVAAIVVPAIDDFSGFRAAYLVCSNCYSKQKRLDFKSLADLREHLKTHRGSGKGRPKGSIRGATDLIAVRLGHVTAKPSKSTNTRKKPRAKRLADCANPLTELIKDIEDFEALMVKKIGDLKAILLEAMPLMIEDSEKLHVKTRLEPRIDEAALSDDIDPGDTRETADEDFGIDDDDDDFMTDEQRAKFEALKNRSGPVLPTMAPPEVDRSDW